MNFKYAKHNLCSSINLVCNCCDHFRIFQLVVTLFFIAYMLSNHHFKKIKLTAQIQYYFLYVNEGTSLD